MEAEEEGARDECRPRKGVSEGAAGIGCAVISVVESVGFQLSKTLAAGFILPV